MWYDNSQLLSYNGILNFVLGNRGGGKSFNAKKWAINDFLKKGKQFVYVRRYKSELKTKESFFKDIASEFPKCTFKVDGDKAYINKKVAGYFVALSVGSTFKSTPFPDVNKIIFDEFIISGNKRGSSYIKNEVEEFLDLYETIARTRDDVRALFLGNSVSSINPYFTFFNIRLNDNERFTVVKDGLVVVELFKDQDFINMKNKTRFGKLIKNTKYGDYAVENKFLRDNNSFIEKNKPKGSRFMYSLKIDGKEYGAWISKESDYIYFNKQVDTSSVHRYTLTKTDHAPNFLLIRNLKNNNIIKTLLYSFENGLVRFNNLETKQDIYEIIGFFSTR